MTGFFLLLGHLLGDYIFQNDWQALNKTNLHPDNVPGSPGESLMEKCLRLSALKVTDPLGWTERLRRWKIGHVACTVHCLLYTLAIWACSFWWMPWWGLVACFVIHWPVDRWRLAGWWMRNVSRQTTFADKMGPWSIIVVDNTFHLLTLGVIYLMACGVPQ